MVNPKSSSRRATHDHAEETDAAVEDEGGEPAHVSRAEADMREAQAAERNPDPTTRREALELELMDEERSEAGEQIGDEMP